jgi:hypothetical protein
MYHTFPDKEVHHRADKSPPIDVFLNQMNPVLDALWSYCFRHVLLLDLLPHLHVDLQSCLFLISHQNPLRIYLFSHTCRAPNPSHAWLDNLIVICPEVHIMKPFIQSILQPYLAPSVLVKHRFLFVLFRFQDATVLRGQGLLIVEASRSHSFTQHIGRTSLDEWSARRRELWQHTTLTGDRHPCHRRDSNPLC